MSNSQNPSAWERVAGLLIAFGVIVTFVFFVFNPPVDSPHTGAIIRFLAAVAAALSAYLFTGDLAIGGQLFNKTQVRAAGAFAAFIAVFMLFNLGIPQNTQNPAGTSNTVAPIETTPFEEPQPSLGTEDRLLEDADLIELGALLRNMASLSPKPGEEAATWNKLRSVSAPIEWDTDYPGDGAGSFAYAWPGKVSVRINKVPDLDATGRSPVNWSVSAQGARALISYISLARDQSLGMSSEDFEENITESIRGQFQEFNKICEAGQFPNQSPANILFEGKFDNMTVPILLRYSVGASDVFAGFSVYFETNSPSIRREISCLN